MSATTISVATGTPQSTPEARVRAFIADYFQRHGQSTRVIDAGDFTAWQSVIDGLDQAHFIAGAHSGLGNSMSNKADHHPDTEKITGSTAENEGVQIQTYDPEASPTRYYEYDLRQVSGDWRIQSLRGYVESPDEPFMTPAQRERFQDPEIHDLRRLPREDAGFDALRPGSIPWKFRSQTNTWPRCACCWAASLP